MFEERTLLGTGGTSRPAQPTNLAQGLQRYHGGMAKVLEQDTDQAKTTEFQQVSLEQNATVVIDTALAIPAHGATQETKGKEKTEENGYESPKTPDTGSKNHNKKKEKKVKKEDVRELKEKEKESIVSSGVFHILGQPTPNLDRLSDNQAPSASPKHTHMNRQDSFRNMVQQNNSLQGIVSHSYVF